MLTYEWLFSEDLKYTETNMVFVDMFFGKMSYQKLEEKLAYSIFDMIGRQNMFHYQ